MDKNKSVTAKKDFIICQNQYYFEIKKGDDIEKLNIPNKFFANLKKEKVI